MIFAGTETNFCKAEGVSAYHLWEGVIPVTSRA